MPYHKFYSRGENKSKEPEKKRQGNLVDDEFSLKPALSLKRTLTLSWDLLPLAKTRVHKPDNNIRVKCDESAHLSARATGVKVLGPTSTGFCLSEQEFH